MGDEALRNKTKFPRVYLERVAVNDSESWPRSVSRMRYDSMVFGVKTFLDCWCGWHLDESDVVRISAYV
jgi:hypothetical protein